MKFVFVNRYFFPDHSATSQLLTDLATFLRTRGHEVVVISSRQLYDDPSAQLPRREIVGGVAVRRIWTSRFGRRNLAGRAIDYASFYLSCAVELKRVLGAGDVIVAKTDPPLISVVAAAVSTLRGARLVNWLQDLFPEVAEATRLKLAAGRVSRALLRLRNASLRAAAVNVVIGERMEQYLRSNVNGRLKIEVVPNWADGRMIKPIPAGDNFLKREWGLEHKFVVVYSGNFGRVHDARTLLDAAASLAGTLNLVFVIIGGGRKHEWLRREVEVRGLHNIAFKPYQPQEKLAFSLGVADIHLVTQDPATEGLVVPSKFFGVAAAGKPSIFVGARDGEIARLLQRFDCGRTVDPGDSIGLAEHIIELRTNVGLRAVLGANARKAFEEHFDKPLALEKWATVLESVGIRR